MLRPVENDIIFSPGRFDFSRCFPACRESDLDSKMLSMLECAFDLFPFVISRAYCSAGWCRQHGISAGAGYSRGQTVLIKCVDDRVRFFVFRALLRAGFTRFAFGPRAIQVSIYGPDHLIFIKDGL